MGVNPRRGIGPTARPLLRKDILAAQEVTRSGAEAARYLGVSPETYKKYATLYGVYERHKNTPGRNMAKRRLHGVFGLESILAGEHPTYSPNKLKERLIKAGYLAEQCWRCGFDERRVLDGRVPLTLDFVDGERTNFRRENLRLICFNCQYLTVGKVKLKDEMHPKAFDEDLLATGAVSLADIQRLQDELMDEMEAGKDGQSA